MCYAVVSGFFFFVKQKTADEMRISDWSSDVCSSDLHADVALAAGDRAQHPHFGLETGDRGQRAEVVAGETAEVRPLLRRIGRRGEGALQAREHGDDLAPDAGDHRLGEGRSEEHTSELQSLMRIPYAVFCLKKKNT